MVVPAHDYPWYRDHLQSAVLTFFVVSLLYIRVSCALSRCAPATTYALANVGEPLFVRIVAGRSELNRLGRYMSLRRWISVSDGAQQVHPAQLRWFSPRQTSAYTRMIYIVKGGLGEPDVS